MYDNELYNSLQYLYPWTRCELPILPTSLVFCVLPTSLRFHIAQLILDFYFI